MAAWEKMEAIFVSQQTRRRAVILFAAVLAIGCLTLQAAAQAVTLVPVVSKYAGTGTGLYTGDFGTSSFVALNAPSAVAFDSAGNLYVADTLNNCVRRIDAASTQTTTVAGLVVSSSGDTCNTATNPTPTAAQGLYQPGALVFDTSDNLYIADTGHNCVRMLASHTSGTASTQVVTGTCTAPNTGGTVTAGSSIPQPTALALDGAGSLYLSLRDPANSTALVVRQAIGAPVNSLCRMAGAATVAGPTSRAGGVNSVTLNQPGGIALCYLLPALWLRAGAGACLAGCGAGMGACRGGGL